VPKAPKKVHLVCNAHMDPVWVWRWEDGLTEAISTFRVACDFCERVKGFIFCHNEAVLYRWVEDHDAALFRRIQRLVRAGKWHIAGGSFIQPDVNMPSGESHIRQFLIGRTYFREKFGVEPATAYNFDSFGQAAGYPQILAGCGCDSYIHCRPDTGQWKLPTGPYRWRDRSGAEVLVRRSEDFYASNQKVYEKLEKNLPCYRDEPEPLMLWGIGNHGGGPSREDLRQIEKFSREHPEYRLVHSTPEAFFAAARRRREDLPVVVGEMQNCSTGCYTSMSRVKRQHRHCESLMAAVERMAAMAWWLGKAEYPAADLDIAWRDILFGEFHDIITGSAIPSAEKDSLALFSHCSEVLRRARTKLFLRLLDGEPAGRSGDVPIFVWNPHGFAVSEDVECEFSYANMYSDSGAIELTVRDGRTGRNIPFQTEQAEWPFPPDWRMRVAVPLTLRPFEMRRLEISWKKRAKPQPWRTPPTPERVLEFEGKWLSVMINSRTGLIDSAGPAGGENFVGEGAFQPAIWPDLSHAWRCGDPASLSLAKEQKLDGLPWTQPRDAFRLATAAEMESFLQPMHGLNSDKRPKVAPVHVVEDGPVRTIVEAVFLAGASRIIRRYVLSRKQNWLEIRDRILWNEPDSMLKVALPLNFPVAETTAETPYSAITRPVPKFHTDQPAQRWVVAAENGGGRFAAALNDGSGAYSVSGNTLYLSVLRSPMYAAFGLEMPLVTDRMSCRCWPRQEQGEHEVRYRFVFGRGFAEAEISRAAQVMNIAPEWIIHYPAGHAARTTRQKAESFITVSPDNVQVVAVKKAERGGGLVVRLWEQSGRKMQATVGVRGAGGRIRTTVGAYGLKTLILRRKGRSLIARESNLVEQT
jgi:alpha-mannosidase